MHRRYALDREKVLCLECCLELCLAFNQPQGKFLDTFPEMTKSKALTLEFVGVLFCLFLPTFSEFRKLQDYKCPLTHFVLQKRLCSFQFDVTKQECAFDFAAVVLELLFSEQGTVI